MNATCWLAWAAPVAFLRVHGLSKEKERGKGTFSSRFETTKYENAKRILYPLLLLSRLYPLFATPFGESDFNKNNLDT